MPLGFSIIGSTVTFDLFLRWATQVPLGPLVWYVTSSKGHLLSCSNYSLGVKKWLCLNGSHFLIELKYIKRSSNDSYTAHFYMQMLRYIPLPKVLKQFWLVTSQEQTTLEKLSCLKKSKQIIWGKILMLDNLLGQCVTVERPMARRCLLFIL